MTSTTTSAIKTIKFGHTPDPDDAFMFYGFATKQCAIPGYEIEHILEDIQSLNQRALKKEIEITAISAAVYPYLNNQYWILPIGASVGRNYGPIIAKKAGSNPAGKKIGVPGQHTTASLLLKFYMPDLEPVVYRFDQIPDALNKGEIDYGLLIHEAQITFEKLGFEKVKDLGEEWGKETNLPIPLGLDVVRRDLGKDLCLEISKALKTSIEIAQTQRDQAIDYSMKYGRDSRKDLIDRFVGMYVNNDTLELGEDGEKALNILFNKAYKAGIIPHSITAEILRP